MDTHWQPEGYTVPNTVTYPFAWLWDSCFHSIIWCALGEADRAVRELTHALRLQDPTSGFVPHVDYQRDPDRFASFWGRSGQSSITQPPMFGHAVATLQRAGVEVPDDVVERAARAVQYFLRERRHTSGLVAARHPWETGCDDSPRFDHWGARDAERWYDVKGELVRDLPDNGFDCAPVSLSALVSFNACELGLDDNGVAGALATRWDDELLTWVDAGDGATSSGRIRTLEGLLPALVCSQPDALAQLGDGRAFGGAFGPPGVHRAEPVFDRRRYWRGPVWPQLAYLLWRAGAPIADETVRGALTSGLAEYWDPDDGAGLGAVPQSWAGLALLMSTVSQA
jgi:hypothetical protein